MTILRIALPTPLRRLFDYLPPQGIDLKGLKQGSRILAPFGSRKLIGILVDIVHKSDIDEHKLKSAITVLDSDNLLTPDLFQLCEWAADYYHYALGEILSAALPGYLRKGKALPDSFPLLKQTKKREVSAALPLNTAQAHAVRDVLANLNHYHAFLLDGVTGSGKTEVYLQVIADVLKAGKQVLVLVPEISLTPQTIARFESRFTIPIAVLHSSIAEKKRMLAWYAAKTGEAKIIIGTRSAVFTPFANLGLIIVDEEHDTSFKQQDRFRYHARDVAIKRANLLQIPIVLGSATPSFESLLNVNRERYTKLALPERAGVAVMPAYHFVDLNREEITEGLSSSLIHAMQHHLKAGNQVMLFINRRGFAPVLYCTECAWVASCQRCDARLVYHRSPARLQCHHCDARRPIPKKCDACKGEVVPVGIGTQRLEETLMSLFPTTPIIRIDRDTTKQKDAMENLLTDVHAGTPAILLGTQMLAKGHHFPRVTLVGIIDADSGLFSADFRAAEQMGQLLLQVAGRAGREAVQGTVLIQTRHPEHPLFQLLIQHGYTAYADQLMAERQIADLPPYSHFAIFKAEAHAEKTANDFLLSIKSLKQLGHIKVIGPVPALLSKRKGLYCQHLILKATSRSSLHHHLKHVLTHLTERNTKQPAKWVLDVDPIEI